MSISACIQNLLKTCLTFTYLHKHISLVGSVGQGMPWPNRVAISGPQSRKWPRAPYALMFLDFWNLPICISGTGGFFGKWAGISEYGYARAQHYYYMMVHAHTTSCYSFDKPFFIVWFEISVPILFLMSYDIENWIEFPACKFSLPDTC